MISQSKKNKLIQKLNRASRKRYKTRLYIGYIKCRHNITHGLKQELKKAEKRKIFFDQEFDDTYDKLIAEGVAKEYIEDRMWYNQL